MMGALIPGGWDLCERETFTRKRVKLFVTPKRPVDLAPGFHGSELSKGGSVLPFRMWRSHDLASHFDVHGTSAGYRMATGAGKQEGPIWRGCVRGEICGADKIDPGPQRHCVDGTAGPGGRRIAPDRGQRMARVLPGLRSSGGLHLGEQVAHSAASVASRSTPGMKSSGRALP